jgi:hypothetical protein
LKRRAERPHLSIAPSTQNQTKYENNTANEIHNVALINQSS